MAGPINDDDHHIRADLRMVAQAARNKWDVPFAAAERAIASAVEILENRATRSDREVKAAREFLLSASRAQLEAVALELKLSADTASDGGVKIIRGELIDLLEGGTDGAGS